MKRAKPSFEKWFERAIMRRSEYRVQPANVMALAAIPIKYVAHLAYAAGYRAGKRAKGKGK